ncbi:MAG: hypothetical protein M3O70_00800 [Actinomycetota bacterium]|nr:hypothetical protein [Actinomycetota bacterium]
MAPIPEDRRDHITDRLSEVRAGGGYHERSMQVIVGEEVRPIIVTDPAEASKLGYQANAVAANLIDGDETWLQGLRGETVTGVDPTTGQPVTWQLQTDPTVIAYLYDAGELDDYEAYGDVYGLYAATEGERPLILVVAGTFHVTPQCKSRRMR